MNSVNNVRDIKESATACIHRYNWQHMVFVSKYRYRMFKNPETCRIIHDAIYDAARREDFQHVHLEIDVPNTMSVSTAVQLLKGYSAYVVFKEMPNHRLRYWRGHFWSEGYSNGSVGPQNEETIQNYIRKQDQYGQMRLAA